MSDNDDDGESTAGQKLAGLLELMGANNVLDISNRPPLNPIEHNAWDTT